MEGKKNIIINAINKARNKNEFLDQCKQELNIVKELNDFIQSKGYSSEISTQTIAPFQQLDVDLMKEGEKIPNFFYGLLEIKISKMSKVYQIIYSSAYDLENEDNASQSLDNALKSRYNKLSADLNKWLIEREYINFDNLIDKEDFKSPEIYGLVNIPEYWENDDYYEILFFNDLFLNMDREYPGDGFLKI